MRLIHIALWSNSFSFHHCQTRLQFISSSYCGWAIGLFLVWGHYEDCCCEHSCGVWVNVYTRFCWRYAWDQEIDLFSSCTEFLSDLLPSSLPDDDPLHCHTTPALNCKLLNAPAQQEGLPGCPSSPLQVQVNTGASLLLSGPAPQQSCWLCLCSRCYCC